MGKSLTTIPDRPPLLAKHRTFWEGLFPFTYGSSDVLQLSNLSFLYGRVTIIDIMNGNIIESSKWINIVQDSQNSLITIPERCPLMINLQISKKRIVRVISAIFLLSFAILATTQGRSQLAFAQGMNADMSENNSMMTLSSSSSSLPQPNANGTLLKVEAKNVLFEPAAGLSNVFGPEGLFPFVDVFKCADALTCGVSGGDDAKFTATFEEGNKNNMTSYEATYSSPVTYGPHQIKGHTYKITLTDTQWNTPDAELPTKNAEFSETVNNVGFNQIQHGASQVDRSDVPQLSDLAFLYGHAKVTDITNGNNTDVTKDIFTHAMVAHVMDETAYYRNMKDEAKSPTLVLLFGVNIPNDVELPGAGRLRVEKAQSFTPLSSDPSLKNPPQFDYPVKRDPPRTGEVEEPESQSAIWPVANPKQPLCFTFLVFQNVDAQWTSTGQYHKQIK